MVPLLRLGRWILTALGRLGWGLVLACCFFLGLLFGWGRKEHEIQEQETKAPEELTVREQIDEDEDAQRRWFNDLGPEGRRLWVLRQQARTAFKPATPFIPFWKQKRRA